MREHVDLNVLVNWVRMLRSEVDGAIWIADDDEEARFYERCAHESGRVVPAPTVAVALLREVELRGTEGVVATVRDTHQPCLNIFRPSVGDAISILVFSKSWDRAVEELCGSAWLRASERDIGSVRTRIVSIASSFAAIVDGFVSEGLTPTDLTNHLADVLRWNTMEPNWDRIWMIVSEAGMTEPTFESVRRRLAQDGSHTDIGMCDGMTAVRILAAASQFFRPRGIKADHEVTVNGFIAIMRATYELHELRREPMFWSMRRWERGNARYPLLARWRLLDPLNVLLDQRYWEDDLEYLLGLMQADEHLSAFKMDLDNFRSVNNVLSHAAGDEAIRLYGSIVREVLGTVAECYRRGGDEVVAFAPGVDATSALGLAETLRARIEAGFREWGAGKGLNSPPTASIGIASVETGTSKDAVVHLMDEAQHEAKALGKNRVVLRR